MTLAFSLDIHCELKGSEPLVERSSRKHDIMAPRPTVGPYRDQGDRPRREGHRLVSRYPNREHLVVERKDGDFTTWTRKQELIRHGSS